MASGLHKGISSVTLAATENPKGRIGLWRKSKSFLQVNF